ncbi:uncharacterized protein LOC117193488 [Drosophila miranda]|uniref:uncharacterized protein LOC117193488 n=1 Tax=Drosophila miranda TaxID=7229 RepID=UPI00143F6DC5|nr:uncharacterized protein LOC117193488 [Drosophila miranda]
MPPAVGIYNDTTPTPLAGSYAWTTPNGSSGNYMPRKLPDLPVFGGQPEDWPIFLCAYTETTLAYNCTDLENNQRLLKALKDEARETVKSLLFHPSNVSTVVEQLRFIYGRPEQLIRSQLSGIREVPNISEHNLAKIIPFATRGRNQSVDCYMLASTKTEASSKTAVSEVVKSVEGNMQLKAAETSMELLHQTGGGT